MRHAPIVRVAVSIAALTGMIITAASTARASYPGANGEIAYLVFGGSDFAIRAIAPDAGDRKLSIGLRRAGDAEYSPDGSQVVIAEWGRQGRLVVQDVATSARRVILRRGEVPGGMALSLGVSPDGTRIVFCSLLRAGWRLFVIGTDGSDLTKISRGTDDCHADWGVNDRIVASQELGGVSGERQVFHMAPDGSDRQIVVTLPGSRWRVTFYVVPNWAPDASRIVFGAQRNGPHSDIWAVDPDGSDLMRLTKTKRFNEYGPLWAPDASGIVFTAARVRRSPFDIRGDLYLADTDGLNKTRLTNTPRRDEYSRSWQALPP